VKSLPRHWRVMAGVMFALLTTVVGALAWQSRTGRSIVNRGSASADTLSTASPDTSASAVLDADIAFYEERAATDPTSAGDHAKLALLFLERVRVSGDQGDAERAEQAARRSLAARTRHNDGAVALLASSLLEQHRFAEGNEVARHLVARDSSVVAHRALLAETELELGNYDASGELFRSLKPYWRELAVAPRVARWMEIRGQIDVAQSMLDGARKNAIANSYLPRSQVAWFHFRLGDFEMRYGRHRQARTALEAGLGFAPDDYRLLATMASLEAAEQRWGSAIGYATRSIALFPDPAVLGLLSDAYLAQGDTGKSSEFARAVAVLSLQQPGPIHRSWSLFWLDREEHVEDVLARALEEIKVRRDIYGYDVLAWALHKAGRHTEAKVAISRALALGTRDPSILFHAALISRALGDTQAAGEQLERVLDVNPRFHPRHASVARAVLDSVKHSPGTS